MKNIIRFVALCFFVTLCSCYTNKKIQLVFSDDVNNALVEGINEVKTWTKDSIKPKIFAVIDKCHSNDCSYSIKLSLYGNNLPRIMKLIKQTNRRIILQNGMKIPVISIIDGKASFFSNSNEWQVLFYGYYIAVGYDEKVIAQRWLY